MITLDKDHDIPIFSKVCSYCKHFKVAGAGLRICSAFPEGIPMEIWLGKNLHTKPIKGQLPNFLFKSLILK